MLYKYNSRAKIKLPKGTKIESSSNSKISQQLMNLSEGIAALQTLDRYNSTACFLLLRFGLDLHIPLFLDRYLWSPSLSANIGSDASRLVLYADSNGDVLRAWLANLVRTSRPGIFFQILPPNGIGMTFFVFPDSTFVAPVHRSVRVIGLVAYTMQLKILFIISRRVQELGVTLRIFFL
jgi:hypothetical protein